jgi:hypothetical protein
MLMWLLVLAACGADVRRVPAALYLSRCPHGLPPTFGQWGSQMLEHVIAFPLSSVAMSGLCIVHSLLDRPDGFAAAVLRAVAMLLMMPFICELAWEASASLENRAIKWCFSHRFWCFRPWPTRPYVSRLR